MDSLVVECLSCGAARVARWDVFRHFDAPECPHCGYLGWAPVRELSDDERRKLRRRPLEQRRVRIA